MLSMPLNDLNRESAKYREALSKANESNEALHRAMSAHISNLKILCQPLPEVDKQIPKVTLPDPTTDGPAVAELCRLLSKVDEMRQQRATLVDQLREATRSDDITGRLVTRQTGVDLDQLFDSELAKHRPQAALIEQNLAAQQNILMALTDAYAKLSGARKHVVETFRRRDQVVQALIASYDAYDDLLAKANKGIDFYQKLETNVTKLLQRLRSTCRVQEEEREQKAAKQSTPPPVTVPTTPKLRDYLQQPGIRPAPLGSEQTEAAKVIDQAHALAYSQYYGQVTPQVAAIVKDNQIGYSYGSTSGYQSYDNKNYGQSVMSPTTRSAFQSPNIVTTPYVQPTNASENYGGQGIQTPQTPSSPAYNTSARNSLDSGTTATIYGQQMYQNQYVPQGSVQNPQGLTNNQNTSYVNPQGSYPSQNTTNTPTHESYAATNQGQYPSNQGSYNNQGSYQRVQGTSNQSQGAYNQQQQGVYQNYPSKSPQSSPGQYNSSQGQSYSTQKPYVVITQGYNLSQGQYSNIQAQITQGQMPQGQYKTQGLYTTQGQYYTPQGQYQANSNNKGQQYPTSQEQYVLSQGQYPVSQDQYTMSQGQYPTTQGQYVISQGQYPTNYATGQYPMSQYSQGQYPTSQGQYSTTQGQYPTTQGQQQYSQSSQGQYQGQYTTVQGQYPTSSPGVAYMTSQYYSQGQYPVSQGQTSGNGQYATTQVTYTSPEGQCITEQVVDQGTTKGLIVNTSSYPTQHGAYMVPQGTYPQPENTYITSHAIGKQQYPVTSTMSQFPVPSVGNENYPDGYNGTGQQQLTHRTSNVDLLSGLDFNVTQVPLDPVKAPVTDTLMETPVKDDSNNKGIIMEVQANDENIADNSRLKVGCSGIDNNNTTTLPNFGEIDMDRFKRDVEILQKWMSESFETEIEKRWRDLQQRQEKDCSVLSISVARCYPGKNRCPDSLPYDKNRIELPIPPAVDDYINASSVPATLRGRPTVILTQTPLSTTIGDFWMMVNHRKCETIVCLATDTELKEAGLDNDYWGVEYNIQIKKEKVSTHWIERTLMIGGKEVTHFQLTAQWPTIEGETVIVGVLADLANYLMGIGRRSGEIVIHCLTGVGRTGVLCALLHAAADIVSGPRLVDMQNVVAEIAKCRKNPLRDRLHFSVAYRALLRLARNVLPESPKEELPPKREATPEPEQPKDPFGDIDPLWKLKLT